MTQLLHDIMVYDFWRRAIAGGLIIAAVCSLLSVYVVLKRMAFIGQGISHSAFGGIALGAWLFAGTAAADAKIYATALIFCLVVAFLIAATTHHSNLAGDSVIGIFFVVSMAAGVIFFKLTPGYNRDLYSYLFGSIVALTARELVVIAVLGAAVALPLLLLQKELLYYAFDEDMAAVSGIPVRFLHYFLLVTLSLMIIVSVRMVGIILVSAFLILPGATAQLVARRFRWMVILSVVAGVTTTIAGLGISWATDWPTGAAIVVVQFAVFSALLLARRAKGAISARYG